MPPRSSLQISSHSSSTVDAVQGNPFPIWLKKSSGSSTPTLGVALSTGGSNIMPRRPFRLSPKPGLGCSCTLPWTQSMTTVSQIRDCWPCSCPSTSSMLPRVSISVATSLNGCAGQPRSHFRSLCSAKSCEIVSGVSDERCLCAKMPHSEPLLRESSHGSRPSSCHCTRSGQLVLDANCLNWFGEASNGAMSEPVMLSLSSPNSNESCRE
mmetsp:Transcript_42873/g.101787  ORF Transcript_42873/g.101787 Transcript_42873/m.101787 type:complete len:210 (+) Transcript_42873:220-849(+)